MARSVSSISGIEELVISERDLKVLQNPGRKLLPGTIKWKDARLISARVAEHFATLHLKITPLSRNAGMGAEHAILFYFQVF